MPPDETSSSWRPCSTKLTTLEDEDAVGVADGGEAVGDDDGGAANGDLFERALDEGFGLVVDRGGGFVEDEDGRVFEDGARNGDALTLSAGELLSALADDGVVALRQGHDEVVRFGDLGGFDDLLVGGIEGAVGDVLADGAVEEIDVLADKADGAAQVCRAAVRAGHARRDGCSPLARHRSAKAI